MIFLRWKMVSMFAHQNVSTKTSQIIFENPYEENNCNILAMFKKIDE